MRPRPGRGTRLAVPVLVAALLGPRPGLGCGFDGLMSDGFGATHPRSVGVALAISDAVGDGLLDRSAAAPVTPGSAGYWRAVGHLSALGQALAGRGLSSPVSVLLIDSNLWSRVVPAAGGVRLEPHAAGPADGDVVVVTSEPVLVRLLDGAMTSDLALARGLLAVAGPAGQEVAVRDLVAAGLADRGAARPRPLGFPRPSAAAPSGPSAD